MADLKAKIAITAHLDRSVSRSVRQAKAAITSLDRAVDKSRQRTEVGELAAEYRELGRRADRAMDQASGGARQATAALGAQERAVGRVRRSLAAGVGGGGAGGLGALGALASGAAILGAGRSAVRGIEEAMDLSELRVRMRLALVSDDADTDAARLARRAASTARDTLATESELLESQIGLSGANIAASAVGALSERAHRVAVVTRGEALGVGKVMGQAFNLFGDEFEGDIEQKAMRIGDVLAATQIGEDLLNFHALGEGLKNVAGTAKDMNLQFAHAVRTVGVLNTMGVTGSEAGTAAAAMLREIPKAAKEAGIEVARAEDGTLDLVETLRRLDATMAGLNQDERTLRLGEMFGETARMAVSPLMGILDDLGVKFAETLDGLGLVDRNYGTLMDDASGRFKIATQRMAQARDELNAVLATAAAPYVEGLSEGARSTADFLERNPGAQDAGDWLLSRGVALAALLAGGAGAARLAKWKGLARTPHMAAVLGAYDAAEAHFARVEDFERAGGVPEELKFTGGLGIAGVTRARPVLPDASPDLVHFRTASAMPDGGIGPPASLAALDAPLERPRPSPASPAALDAPLERPQPSPASPPALDAPLERLRPSSDMERLRPTSAPRVEIKMGDIHVDARGMTREEVQEALENANRTMADDAVRRADVLMADVRPRY